MSNLNYNRDKIGLENEEERGFKKNSANLTFIGVSQTKTQSNKLPSYTYRTLDSKTGKSRNNLLISQEVQIRSPRSVTTFAKINFSQRASNSNYSKQNQSEKPKNQQEDKLKFTHQVNEFQTISNQPFNYLLEQPIKFAQNQHQLQRKDSKTELSRAKSLSQSASQKEDKFQLSLINGLSFTDPVSNPYSYYSQKSDFTSNREVQDYKLKVLRLQRELTQMSLQKGQLILQLAQLSRQSNDIKKQLKQFKQAQLNKQVQIPKVQDSSKVQIDKELLIQIQNISQRQKQINQTKQQFIQLASAGYQKQIKRLIHQGGLLKLQNQRINVELTIAKQDIKQKQLKIQFLQKELLSLQQKQKQSAKLENQKCNQIKALKHSLKALQTKYKAQSRELANKQDYILKYIVSRGENQDLEAIKGLASHTRQIEDMSEVQSQLQSQSQVNSVKLLNSRQP